MAEIPNIRIGSDVTIHVTLADGGVKVSWADLEQVTARIYSELRRAVAGPCTVKVNAEDPYTLDVLYEAGRPQYTGIQRLVVSGIYRGVHKTYDAVVCNFVATTEEAVGTIEVELADYTAEGTAGITVTDIDTSVLEGAIKDVQAATASANQAAADAIALDKEVAANEEERKANEEERKANEDTRKSNETTRKSAETTRKNNEAKRGESEEARALAEEERKSNEEARAAAELERAAAEAKRGESESTRELAEQERKEAEEGRKSAEAAREAKASKTIAQVKSDTAAAVEKTDAATEGATTATTAAKEATTAAQTATTEAKTATTDANAAAKAATEAKEAIEQDTAVVKTSAQELTDEQAAQARENIGAEFLHRALGKYNAIGERTLSVGTSGKYIDVNGNEVSNSAYAISEPISLGKGDDLLIPSASPVVAAVSVVSRKITNTYDEPIIYDIDYADDGKIATATAQYDKTLVYTAVYEDDTLTGWTMGGTSYDSLPATHSVTRSFYVPLVNQSVAAMPDTGYYVFPADEVMEVVISAFTATVNGGVCKVYGVGLIKNYATNMVGQNKQHVLAEVIADLYARLESLEKMLSGEIGSLTVGRLTVRRAIEGADIEGGKDLRGAGAPSASVLPEKWDAETYGEWLGIPQFIGQMYDDTTNKIAYRAEGVTSVSDWKRITNA